MLIDKKVYSLEEASVKYINAIWINAVQKSRNEILRQLNDLKIPAECIVNYIFE